jgi:hypothetical protein
LSDLTELLDLRLCYIVISVHYGNTTDTGNTGKVIFQNRRQPNRDGQKSRENDHKSKRNERQPGKGGGQHEIQSRLQARLEARIDTNRESDRDDLKGMMAEMNAKMDSSEAKMRFTVCVIRRGLKETIQHEIKAVREPNGQS